MQTWDLSPLRSSKVSKGVVSSVIWKWSDCTASKSNSLALSVSVSSLVFLNVFLICLKRLGWPLFSEHPHTETHTKCIFHIMARMKLLCKHQHVTLSWLTPSNGLLTATTLQPKLLAKTVGPDFDHRDLCYSLYPYMTCHDCPLPLSLSMTLLQTHWILTVSRHSNSFLSQALCTCCSSCCKHSFSVTSHFCLPLTIEILIK